MRTRSLARLLAPVALLVAGSTARADQTTAVGFNQAWLPGKFGTDLTSTFDETLWRQALKRTHDAGGSVLRVWLFEGEPGQGIQWDANDPHRPSGVDPALVANVRRLAAMAAEEHVQIYWTARDGNAPLYWDKSKKVDTDRAWNIDSDKYGFGEQFDQNVLGPVLDAIHEKPEATYGFDVLNEVEGMVSNHSWADGWDGARRYIARETAFVHCRAPGMKVSASAGWGSAAKDILGGRFDGLGLDFLDVHQYSDDAKVDKGKQLVEHAREQGVPIIVGEFGQSAKKLDPALQARVVTGVLEDASRLGFQAALAWQLSDEETRLSFYDGDVARPGIEAMRRFAAEHAPPPPTPAPAPAAAATPEPAPSPSLGIVPALEGATKADAAPIAPSDNSDR